MNEGRFVLAERKSPGRLFYVIKDDSQEELEKFVSWVENKYPEYTPIEISFTENPYGKLCPVLYLTEHIVKQVSTSRTLIVLQDFPVFIRLEEEINALTKTKMDARYNYEPWKDEE